MKFKVGDRVKCLNSKGLKFGVITASQESGVTGRTWYIVQPASNSEWCNESELELIQPEACISQKTVADTLNHFKETNMKFKVGDRVKHRLNGNSGMVEVVISEENYPITVYWDNRVAGLYKEDELELIQPKPQEPVPGKFYRTVNGQKLKYITETARYYLYEETNTQELFKYNTPFVYNTNGDADWGIVGEWVDEVTLPAVKIKQWAVVYSKFVPDIVSRNRGEIFTIFTSPEGHKAAADILLQYPNIPLEIVELTGTLPERKQ